METKKCKICGEEFSGDKKQAYCRVTKTVNCQICGKSFTYICAGATYKVTCSKSCCSKLIRRNKGREDIRKCEICGESFEAKIPEARWCHQYRDVECKFCGKIFQRKCCSRPSQCCSVECRNSWMRRDSYKIKNDRICKYCGESFRPTQSKQVYCGNDWANCAFCGERFKLSVGSYKRHFDGIEICCSNSCSTFIQTKSEINKSKIKEYKNIEQWSKDFYSHYRRKPDRVDFYIYFGINPPRAYKKYLKKSKGSILELVVCNYIDSLEVDYKYVRNNRMIVVPGSKGKWEIDIYFPNLKMGFEIQDFSTHSKDKDDEEANLPRKNGFKPFLKKGPTYHKKKRDAAWNMGIKVVEIWEDEIKNNSYKVIVREALNEALQGER